MSTTPHEGGRLLRWLHRKAGAPDGANDPTTFDPDAVKQVLRFASRFFGPGRYFELDARGMEHVPPKPVMVVSNHSGGTSIPDVWGFGFAWYQHFGIERIIHPLAHEMVLSTKVTARFFGRIGVLRAGRGVAGDVLTRWGRDLLVMPGGDVDTWRPYRDRYKVQFGGRTGYARTAILAGVPIVPVANAGAHETLLVLTDGQRLARRLRLRELTRANVFPISLSFPWGLTIGPWPHLPIPTKMRYRFGAPIQPPPLPPGEAPTEEMVLAMDAAVRAAVQALLDDLRRESEESERVEESLVSLTIPPYPPGRQLLAGKTVLVTAAAGTGIGFAVAKRAVEEGARVMISDVHERRLGEAAAELGGIPAARCNVAVEADVQALWTAAERELGGVDVLINNAGLGATANVVEITDEQWQLVMDVSLTGTMRMMRAGLRHMMPRQRGAIVNNASVLAWRAQAGQAAYAAAKAGVMALTRCAAVEAAVAGVRVNAVSPSLALHKHLVKVTSQEVLDTLTARELFGRGAEPWEVANVIVFLASDYASYMTGEVISVSSQHA